MTVADSARVPGAKAASFGESLTLPEIAYRLFGVANTAMQAQQEHSRELVENDSDLILPSSSGQGSEVVVTMTRENYNACPHPISR